VGPDLRDKHPPSLPAVFVLRGYFARFAAGNPARPASDSSGVGLAEPRRQVMRRIPDLTERVARMLIALLVGALASNILSALWLWRSLP